MSGQCTSFPWKELSSAQFPSGEVDQQRQDSNPQPSHWKCYDVKQLTHQIGLRDRLIISTLGISDMSSNDTITSWTRKCSQPSFSISGLRSTMTIPKPWKLIEVIKASITRSNLMYRQKLPAQTILMHWIQVSYDKCGILSDRNLFAFATPGTIWREGWLE